MRIRLLTSVLLIGSALALSDAPTLAQKKHDHAAAGHKHNHPTAQHGGILEDVGEFHVEMIVKDGKITLYLRDHKAKDVATEGFRASVLLTAGQQRVGPIDVKPAGANKMEGLVGAVPAAATAILTLTDKGGVAAQGRFRLK